MDAEPIEIREIEALDNEIEWCKQNPMSDQVTSQFRAGFIKGLEQAKYLLRELAKTQE